MRVAPVRPKASTFSRCVAPPDAGGAGQAQGFHILPLDGAAVGTVIHQQAPARTVAERLDSQGAGAREQVQHGGAFQRETDAEILVPQHVENRLAGTVGGRAHAGIVRCDKPPSAQFSARNPHSDTVTFCCRWRIAC
jgi:hypothetical protein